jgi:hypothetical protein
LETWLGQAVSPAAGENLRATNWPAWCAAIVLTTGLLLAPALWNQFPLLQWDTGGYLARWFEGYLVPSRPGAYGLLLVAAIRGEFWPVLLVQVAATLWILTLLLQELGLGQRPWLLLGIIALLSATTTLPWLTSILLTDIFAGLAIIALHLLVTTVATVWVTAAFGIACALAAWRLLAIADGAGVHSALRRARDREAASDARRRLVLIQWCRRAETSQKTMKFVMRRTSSGSVSSGV